MLDKIEFSTRFLETRNWISRPVLGTRSARFAYGRTKAQLRMTELNRQNGNRI
jgi:hypothetical protein